MLGGSIKFAQKCHSYPDDSHLSASNLLHNKVPDYSKASLAIGEIGKVHFPEVYSETEIFRPRRKVIAAPSSGADEEKRGKKYIPPIIYPDGRIESIKVFPESSTRVSDDCSLPAVGWKRIGIVKQENGSPVYNRRSEEFQFETYMNRKQRVRDVERLRNGIPIAVSGDKSYKRVELSPNFYEIGGLVPGVNIQLRKKTLPGKKQKELDAAIESQKQTKTLIPYAEKVKQTEHKHEIEDVLALTNTSQGVGQILPSWEEKTGYWLVHPDDEKY